jgi:chromate transporter
VGYLLGGPWTALVATVGMFLPAFVWSALSSMALDRLSASRSARAFLDGVNAAAVALIVVVAIALARSAFAGWPSVALAVAAAALLFGTRVHPTVVLAAAALGGALWGRP